MAKKNKSFNIPILILGFRRPDFTEKILSKLKEVNATQIFFAVDGAREGNSHEAIKVNEVKNLVKKIDWKCKVKTLFRPTNLGCFKATIGAINWFFENVEEGIIFDDDCIPTNEFFNFCEEMLEKYQEDERIMHVCGYNFQRGWQRENYSYYFSRYTYMWGWATWRRAWKKYNLSPSIYSEIKNKKYLKDLYPNWLERLYIKRIMDLAYYQNPDAGDSQWLFSVAINHGLTIVPNKNLVYNAGFREDSGHTTQKDCFLSLPTQKLEFPLKHPPFILLDRISDQRYIQWLFFNKLRKIITSSLKHKK